MDTNEIIESYESGMTLRELAELTGTSMQAIHQRIKRNKPEILREKHGRAAAHREPRPFCGPPHDRLYLQGKCRRCLIPLFGKRPVDRDNCGEPECT